MKILYSDDIEFLRKGVCADLESHEGVTAIACNLELQETLRMVEQESPDVLLLDVLNETDINAGIRIAEALQKTEHRKNGKMKILLLTIFRGDDKAIIDALDKGLADGIVTKPTTTDGIIREVRRVVRGWD